MAAPHENTSTTDGFRSLYHATITRAHGGTYLLEGPPAVGKTAAALSVVRLLFCTQRSGLSACDACPACTKLQRGTHPDLLLLGDQTSNTPTTYPIETARTLINHLLYPPLEAKQRVVVLPDAENLNRHAANALLKTLEEPPADALLILTSSQPNALPRTLLSRCARIRFKPLGVDQRASTFGADANDLRTWDYLGFGFSANAETLTDHLQPLGELRRALGQSLVDFFGTSADRRKNLRALWQMGALLNDPNQDFFTAVGILQSFTRDLYFCAAGVDRDHWIHHDLSPRLCKSAGSLPPKQLEGLTAMLSRTRSNIRWGNPNRKITVESILGELEQLQ